MITHPLFYDSVNHAYELMTGEKLVSNTDLLEAFGFSNYSMVPEPARTIAMEIGSDVAKATALLDGKRPWRKPYSHVQGYVKAWQQFKKDYRFQPNLIERPLYDPYYMVATTPDRWGGSNQGELTVQIKTGKVEDWVGLQLAFEERCVFISLGLVDPVPLSSTRCRFGVELRANGTYKERRFEDPGDIRVYLGMVGVYQWLKKRNGRPAKWQSD